MIIFIISWILIVSILGYILYKKQVKKDKDFLKKLEEYRKKIYKEEMDIQRKKDLNACLIPNKKGELFKSFERYYLEHPEQRFFQALKNWSDYNYIYGSKVATYNNPLEDTFYLNGR